MSVSEYNDLIEIRERVKMRFATAQTDLVSVLEFPVGVQRIADRIYFNEKQNNFHLRIHVNKSWTSDYAKGCTEIHDFLATDEGIDIAKLSTSQWVLANQWDLFNFFLPLKQGNYDNLDLVGYILNLVEWNIVTLKEKNIALPESIIQQLTRENITQRINTVAQQKDAVLSLDSDWSLKRFNDKDISESMNVINEVLTDVLSKLPSENYNNLLFLVYKKFLSGLLSDKSNQEVRDMLQEQRRDDLQEYVEKRYFR